ncbi:GNAT family N-acetyltransferase [Christensenellaceae bacterium 44-20]
MQIIPATAQEMEAVYSLICQLEEQTLPSADFERIYLENLKNPQIFYLLCKDQGEVLGFCSLHIQALLHHAGKIAEVQELVLCPRARGAGAGRALMEAAKQKARQEGCLQIEVCCSLRRQDAHQFYEHIGLEKSHYKFTAPLIPV